MAPYDNLERGNLYMNGQLKTETLSLDLIGAKPDFNDFYIGRDNRKVQYYGRAWYDKIRVYHEYKDITFISYMFP